jgi:protein-S-isoprenylcysteine O-methyltransferase Ste14
VPYVTTVTGFVVFVAAMAIFVAHEFTQGFGTPETSTIRDDRWALLYLDVVPVALVSGAFALSFTGWAAWGMSEVVFFLGVSVLCLGVAIRQWSHRTLGRFHQAVVTIQRDHEVVATGPYRVVRHPMYAGSAVAFLGVGLALGTWPGLGLVVIGTLPAMVRRIRVEEQALHDSLGARYRDYASGRARLLPGVW